MIRGRCFIVLSVGPGLLSLQTWLWFIYHYYSQLSSSGCPGLKDWYILSEVQSLFQSLLHTSLFSAVPSEGRRRVFIPHQEEECYKLLHRVWHHVSPHNVSTRVWTTFERLDTKISLQVSQSIQYDLSLYTKCISVWFCTLLVKVNLSSSNSVYSISVVNELHSLLSKCPSLLRISSSRRK